MTAKRRRELLEDLAKRSTAPDGIDRDALRRVVAARDGRLTDE
jgi:hypothetical protein